MKTAVVGATGMIGSAVTEELLARGHHVTGIARNSDKLQVREALTRRSANLMELDSFTEAIRGHDAASARRFIRASSRPDGGSNAHSNERRAAI